MRTRRSPEIVITGGGTAGHVFPALAIAEAFVAAGYHRSQISFVGSKRGMEGTLVPSAGFAIVLLGGRGIVRRISLQNLVAILGLVEAFLRSIARLAIRRPRAIVSVGGYASVPCSLAGATLRIPVFVVNVDAAPGLANRIVSRVAVTCAVAFPGTSLPRAVVTGAPVREEIEQVTRQGDERRRAKERLGIPERSRLVVVTGGSLGARTINAAAVSAAHAWRDRDDLFVFHIVGDRNMADVERSVCEANVGSNYRYVAFSDEMPMLLSAAEVMVCRAGAMTVAELTVCGIPAILIPLPGAPNDHQRRNAQTLVEHGAAVLLEDALLDGARLADTLQQLFDDPSRLSMMEEASRMLGKRHAAQEIVRLVANVVSGN